MKQALHLLYIILSSQRRIYHHGWIHSSEDKTSLCNVRGAGEQGRDSPGVQGDQRGSLGHKKKKKPNLYLDNLQCVGLNGPTHAYNCFFFQELDLDPYNFLKPP